MGINEDILNNSPCVNHQLHPCQNPNDFKIIHYQKTMFDKGYAFDMPMDEFIEKMKENFDITISEVNIKTIPYSDGSVILQIRGPIHNEIIENIVFAPYLGGRRIKTLENNHAAIVEKKKLIFNDGLLKNIIIPTHKVDGVFHFEDVVRVNTQENGCLEFRFRTTEMARTFADSFRF